MMKHILSIISIILMVSCGMGASYVGVGILSQTFSEMNMVATVQMTSDESGYIVVLPSDDIESLGGALGAVAAMMDSDGSGTSFVSFPTSSSTGTMVIVTPTDAKIMQAYIDTSNTEKLGQYMLGLSTMPLNF